MGRALMCRRATRAVAIGGDAGVVVGCMCQGQRWLRGGLQLRQQHGRWRSWRCCRRRLMRRSQTETESREAGPRHRRA